MIIFKGTEVDLKQGCPLEAPELSSRVVSYRAGYPAHLRRQLERDIFHRKALFPTPYEVYSKWIWGK